MVVVVVSFNPPLLIYIGETKLEVESRCTPPTPLRGVMSSRRRPVPPRIGAGEEDEEDEEDDAVSFNTPY